MFVTSDAFHFAAGKASKAFRNTYKNAIKIMYMPLEFDKCLTRERIIDFECLPFGKFLYIYYFTYFTQDCFQINASIPDFYK